MKVPGYVINPTTYSKQKYAAGKESYINIEEVEPGSELAYAVVRLERETEASYDRLRQIAAYLRIKIR
jgi:hypothetical protein